MFCRNCGAQNEDGARFCTSCGTSLVETAAPVQSAPQQPVYQQPVKPPAQGFAIASMVLGIIGLLIFPYILGTLGIIFGGVAKSKGNKNGMATAGIVMGIIAVALWLVQIAYCNAVVGSFI